MSNIVQIISTDTDVSHVYVNSKKTNLWWFNKCSDFYKSDKKFYLKEKIKCFNFSQLIESGVVKSNNWLDFDTCRSFIFVPKNISFIEIKDYNSFVSKIKSLNFNIFDDLLTVTSPVKIIQSNIVVPKYFNTQYCNCLNKDHSELLENLTVFVFEFGYSFFAS